MTVPTIFETCRPRPDVLTGAIADFAADLASVIAGRASPGYLDPVRFFADTYPTRGLRNLLANVCRRLAGAGAGGGRSRDDGGGGRAGGTKKKALAQEIDAEHHRGLPPYATYVARTVLLHTLAFNDPLKGLPPEQLRYSILCPATDVSFIEEARRKFIAESAYLDDRPGAPMRFLAEANLRQIIQREERHVEAGEARAELNDRIRQIFNGKTFDAVSFPGGPFDVPDEVGDGRPKLVMMACWSGLAMSGCSLGRIGVDKYSSKPRRKRSPW